MGPEGPSAQSAVLRDLVLVGGGHSHAIALRRLAMRPESGVRVTLISRDSVSPYSGMLPGYIAGHYSWDEVHIDLDRLCRFAGARLIRAEVIGIDRIQRTVLLRDRPPIAYDLLSLNIGSTPRLDLAPGAVAYAVGVKPIHSFNERWLALHDRLVSSAGQASIAIVGAGAAGIELAFAIHWRLSEELSAAGRAADAPRITVYTSSESILPSHSPGVRRRVMQKLRQRGIEICSGAPVSQVEPSRLQWRGQWHAHDEIIWVTQAGAAPWLARTGLELDGQGFVKVNAMLQSSTDPLIFAAGDIASLPEPREKAGVFAVRMGMPLADNLLRSLRGEPLRPYRPQRTWLALLATGDRYAVASRGLFSAAGHWVWRWKDWIDRRFMERFSRLNRTDMQASGGVVTAETRLALAPLERQQALSVLAMRCGGCGAKVGADILSRVMARLDPGSASDVIIGLDAPDDAAVIRVPPGKALVQTVDFFRAFLEDPWIFGRIAANHALSDLHAMGAQPHSALAIATIPPGLDEKTGELLFQLMSGALQTLRESGCVLVGGHTAEGQELGLGFAVNGFADESLASLTRKSGLSTGEVLILTKPIGVGTLLVAREALAASGRDIEAALACMMQSNLAAAQCLRRFGARACTDVTGFGLAGHLLEMVRASGLEASIWLDSVPVLSGSIDCLQAGWRSSLHDGNSRVRAAITTADSAEADPRFALLFDPQTSGGLVAGVAAEAAQDCLVALREAGYRSAAVIGEVRAAGSDAALTPLRVEPRQR